MALSMRNRQDPDPLNACGHVGHRDRPSSAVPPSVPLMSEDFGYRLNWQPLSVRDSPAAIEYEVLVEGVPEWLERSLWRWAMDRAVRTPDLVYKAEGLLKITLPKPNPRQGAFHAYWDLEDVAKVGLWALVGSGRSAQAARHVVAGASPAVAADQ